MQARIDPLSGDYDGTRINNLGNAVYLRLMTPLGQYWNDPAFGSRLHELQREKDLARVATQAEQYSRDALRPLIDDGRATRIDVATQRQVGRLALLIEVEDESGRSHQFQYPVRVL